MRCRWRSQPAGYKRCARADAPPGSRAAPLSSLGSETRQCDAGFVVEEEREKLGALEAMAQAERLLEGRSAKRRAGRRGKHDAARPHAPRADEPADAGGNGDASAADGSRPAANGNGSSSWSRSPPLRDPYCWEQLRAYDAVASSLVREAGGHHLRVDRPVLLRTDAYGIKTPHQGAADCMHTCLGATPRLYALAIARFVLAI